MVRAYNDWLADFCQSYQAHLFGAVMVLPQGMDGTIAKARGMVSKLDFNAFYIRPNAVRGRN